MPLEPIPGYKPPNKGEEFKFPPACSHPSHDPPLHVCIPEGYRLRHQCPGCGREQVIYPTIVAFATQGAP